MKDLIIVGAGGMARKVFVTLRRLNEKLAPFKRAVAETGATLQAKVGVYFSMPSCVGGVSGTTLEELSSCDSNNMTIRRNAVLEEAMGIVRILTENHIPCRLITERCAYWSAAQFDTVIAGNAAYPSAGECRKMREFVRGGG